MSESSRICLVSMPFTPVITPALGVSILKTAVAEKTGAQCDVYYGALEFLRSVSADEAPHVAVDDYNFIASCQQIGDFIFSPLLWEDQGPDLASFLQGLGCDRNPLLRTLFPDQEREAMFTRICAYAARLPDFLGCCLQAREWSRYAVVGFSSTFSQNLASLAFARALRRSFPGLHIIFGGANCDGEMGHQLLESFSFVDAVVQGEAEDSFPQYVEAYLAGRDLAGVPGAVIRRGGEIVALRPAVPVEDMDSTPLPDFDDYFEQLPASLRKLERNGQISLPIETSRGCWWGAAHHCVFCGLNPTTMAFRAKSPERALSEFRRLREKYGAVNVTAVDNIISTKYFQSVLPKLEGMGFRIFYETKANLTEAQVRGMARAGVRSIQPGIEGFSAEILQLMKKGVHGYQNLELLKWCSIYGVEPTWFYLYRFPGETAEPYLRDAARFMRWTHLPPPRSPNPVLIDRYSPLFSQRDAFGISNLRPLWYTKWNYPGLSEAERMRICYHFESDLPQGKTLLYEQALWDAIVNWAQRHMAGARLYQFYTAATTLIVDTRRGRVNAFMLTGCAHSVYHAIRCGRSLEALARELPEIESQASEPGVDDIEIACVAGILGAQALDKEPGAGFLPDFLHRLDQEWLAEFIDHRWLALAVDCRDSGEAAQFGLRKFVRTLEVPEPVQQPAFLPPANLELIQLHQTASHAS